VLVAGAPERSRAVDVERDGADHGRSGDHRRLLEHEYPSAFAHRAHFDDAADGDLDHYNYDNDAELDVDRGPFHHHNRPTRSAAVDYRGRDEGRMGCQATRP